VQYESSIWAAQALKEIDSAVEKCSTKVAKIRTFPQANGNSSSVRNLVSYSTTGKTKQNLLASFTVKGDKLVGVYVISNYMFGESEIKRWQNLAKKVGSRL
jgi:predicted secreted Zn-dependent protease